MDAFIEIAYLGIEHSNKLESAIRYKVDSIRQLANTKLHAQVVVNKHSKINEQAYMYSVSIDLDQRGQSIKVEVTNGNVYEALYQVTEILEEKVEQLTFCCRQRGCHNRAPH